MWQEGFHPQMIMEEDVFRQKVAYIHNNPVEEMVVSEPQAYLFSSARDYAGVKGLLDVELVF